MFQDFNLHHITLWRNLLPDTNSNLEVNFIVIILIIPNRIIGSKVTRTISIVKFFSKDGAQRQEAETNQYVIYIHWNKSVAKKEKKNI